MEDSTDNSLLPESKVISSTKTSAECNHPERPMSPVLNTNKLERKILYGRRRERSKSRIKLTNRFADYQNNVVNKADITENRNAINKFLSELQVLETANVKDRLKKIKEYENEKNKLLHYLYIPGTSKSYVSKRKPEDGNVVDGFDFKKPISPVSATKKAKRCTDVILYDRKLACDSGSNRVPNVDLLENDNSHGCSLEPTSQNGDALIGNTKFERFEGSKETEVKSSEIQALAIDSKFEGFCTGGGKSIAISQDSIKKHSKMFDDILNTEAMATNINKRKFNLPGVSSKQEDKFADLSNNCSEKATETNELPPQEVLFMQTSMSDSQMINAANNVLSTADSAEDNCIVSVANITSDFDNKVTGLENTNRKVCEISVNFCDVDAPLEGEKPEFDKNSATNTLESEIVELEKILSKEVPLYSKNLENKDVKSIIKSQSEAELSLDTQETDTYFADFTLRAAENKIVAHGIDSGSEFFDNKIVDVLQCENRESRNNLSVSKEEDYRGADSLDQQMSTTCTEMLNKSISLESEQLQNFIDSKHYLEGFDDSEYKLAHKLLRNFTNFTANYDNWVHQIIAVKPEDGCDTKTFEDVGEIIKVDDFHKPGKHVLSELNYPTKKRCRFDDYPALDRANFGNGEDIQKPPHLTGFATASGKFIDIHQKALEKAQNIFNILPELGKQNALNKNSWTATNKCRNEANHQTLAANILPTSKISDKLETNINFSVGGFKSASGKHIKVEQSSLNKAKTMYKQVEQMENPIEDIKDTVQKTKVHHETAVTTACSAGFSTAGGRNIKISRKAWSKAKTVFSEEDLTSTSLNQEMPFDADKATKTGVSNEALCDITKLPGKEDAKHEIQFQEAVSSVKLGGFSTANGKKISVSHCALQKAKAVFADEQLASRSVEDVDDGVEVAVPIAVVESEEVLHQDTNPAEGEEVATTTRTHVAPGTTKLSSEPQIDVGSPAVNRKPQFLNASGNNQKSLSSLRNSNNSSIAKKRLGISSCKQIAISNDQLHKARLLFDDCEEIDKNSSGSAAVVTPHKFNDRGIYSSTPLKGVGADDGGVTCKPVHRPQIIKTNCLTDINITPVKHPVKEIVGTFKNHKRENDKPSAFVMQEQTEGNSERWLENLSKEYQFLQNKLRVVEQRKKALEVQRELIQNSDNTHGSQRPGLLLQRKLSTPQVSLKEFVGNGKPGNLSVGEAMDLNVSAQILEVAPKNAECLHFNCAWQNGDEGRCSVIHTTEGAVVIPNSSNLVGLAEIKAAFKAMPGVDPKLLPNGWIANHFKWIVWKLASLHRNFPDTFSECLSIENVIQQLKYRYDREIDKAERPVLRRILEKDDVPQKRLILCVADIIKASDNMFELELTDGWYSIRTVIDQPLCKQINASKIVVGTKLIMQYAEILNCEGCHPLEVPDNVRLKIGYNCTRRAAWYSKLGYQRFAEPFPIYLGTISPDGGLVGCIKIYITRVYPLRYMERQGKLKAVWRNKRAEEKRAHDWENQKMKEMEMIHQKVQQDYEKEVNEAKNNNVVDKSDWSKVPEITSPRMLFEMLESAKDPESFRNMLSPSQFASAMEYKMNVCNRQQQELSCRIAREVKNLKCSHRDVIPVLKLQVVDVSKNCGRGYIFNVWKPTEEHLQILKEGSAFSVYHVYPKHNGDLSSSSKSHFKTEQTLSPKNVKMKRHLFPISMVLQSFCKPLFNEFDTIGTVVQIHKNLYYQEVWLTDFVGRLLFIKIVEGPDRCCLLDNLNRGDNVAVMNLIFCKPQDTFGQAIANQCSVITSYPQQSFLREGLSAYCEQLPKDLTALLMECDKKIEVCLTTLQLMKSSRSSSYSSSLLESATTSASCSGLLDDSSEDSTLISTRLTTTDVAMSLIDTDQFFENIEGKI